MNEITGVPIVDWALGLLDTWGYHLVVFFTIFENVFLIGTFTPGDTVVISAAFMASPDRGTLSLWLVWTLSVIGTMIGCNISYLFGRKGGRPALTKHGHRFHFTEERIAQAEAYFNIYGPRALFFSRFATGLKHFVPVIAGASRMPILHFQGWTLLSAIAQTSLMVAIGVFVGENFDRALDVARGFGVFGFIIFSSLIVLVILGRRRYFAHRREEVLEEYLHEKEEHAHEDAGPATSSGDPEKKDGP